MAADAVAAADARRASPAARALPVAFGAGVYQVNVMAGTVLASLLPAGSVSYLFYADRLSQLPYGIIGVAVSTALLPLLSRQVRTGRDARRRCTARTGRWNSPSS